MYYLDYWINMFSVRAFNLDGIKKVILNNVYKQINLINQNDQNQYCISILSPCLDMLCIVHYGFNEDRIKVCDQGR